ncbi:hypothetical protein H8R18_05360 [Nanchangia anserum]|uniref:Uncharacterized protein n=1 Tax=Nanchangia anserum TaxID=2692125 RepID=A0A8I0GCD4_9ACTO|nr:hypothetical protein [Nanchangia anserum]MBD3688968.1 hypothetical protein [Nanchangia anserum]QOX81224.1 hypothetical protein H8R18_05360 [Nanchangia anserum]
MALDPEQLAKLAALTDSQMSEAGSGESAREVDDAPAWEALCEAVTEHCTSSTGELTRSLRLVEDLDMDTLLRYCVITACEHRLKTRAIDADVDAAVTLGDLADALTR